ncbi:Zinc knuckle CX2CX4HX4C [Parasponia andersonii]|uniref:Zinc knuckle CX2CX4HX4C n=1 Tax=Parasponia andersonii TaxID=3476 RepID=A0A2P5BKD5_PARAD|nr:Zinc knuckle CX2CX4HX4C [Parasponia andersonii]
MDAIIDQGRILSISDEDEVFGVDDEVVNEGNENLQVLDDEPWHFDNAHLVLKIVDSQADLGWGEFSYSNFWVQMQNLPPKGMKKKIGGILGNIAGTCIKVDTEADGKCFGSFIRVRIRIEFTKPLRRGANSPPLWVDFRYEKFPHFCFACGRIIGRVDAILISCPRISELLILYL